MDNRERLHAYIVCGADVDERERLAMDIAKRALGGHNFASEGEGFAHPDLHDVYPSPPESNPNSSNLEIRVGQAREARATAQIKPNEGTTHVFIFHDADLMNANAQNALLSTIEEPPTPCLFLFVCANERTLLATIRSRCGLVRAGDGAKEQAADDPEAVALADALMLKLEPADACDAVLPLSRLKGEPAVALITAAREVCMRTAERCEMGSDECRRALDGADRAAKCLDLLAANVSAAQTAAWIASFAK